MWSSRVHPINKHGTNIYVFMFNKHEDINVGVY
jgi:hypothetical protein